MIKRKFFNFFIKILEKIINKKIVYYSKNENNILGKTAVKSAFGFWYVGDVLDSADISYGILNNGLVEKEETNLVVKILNELIKQEREIYFYDIGANTGYYGILAGYLGKGKIKCYSFEPVKEYCNCIQESIRLNRLENLIKIFNSALGDKDEKKFLYLARGAGSGFDDNLVDYSNCPKRLVGVKRLDNVIYNKKLEMPGFIMIDVDGYELNVLKGAEKVIKESLPIMFIEIVYSLKGIRPNFVNKNYNQTLEFIKTLGYKIFCLDNGELLDVKNDFKIDGVKMYLCLPENSNILKI